VSLRKIISAPFLVTAVSLLKVFWLGLEMLSEQTFCKEKLIFGNLLTSGTDSSFTGLFNVLFMAVMSGITRIEYND
jgi:hypothetical protein